MKSGKSKVVKIIEEALAGTGIVVTEQNTAHSATAEENAANQAETSPPLAEAAGSASTLSLLNSLDHIDKKSSDRMRRILERGKMTEYQVVFEVARLLVRAIYYKSLESPSILQELFQEPIRYSQGAKIGRS